MTFVAPQPLADHPFLDPRPIWFAGAGGALVAFAFGLGAASVAAFVTMWVGGAILQTALSARRGLIRPWAVDEPWRSQVHRAVTAWRRHAELAESIEGPVADRLGREHEIMTDVLLNLWRLAEWGHSHAEQARTAPALVAEVRTALAEVAELGDGLELTTRAATELVAMDARPTGLVEVARYDIAELHATSMAYREALGSGVEAD